MRKPKKQKMLMIMEKKTPSKYIQNTHVIKTTKDLNFMNVIALSRGTRTLILLE